MRVGSWSTCRRCWPRHGAPRARRAVWRSGWSCWSGTPNLRLAACILQANPSWKAKSIPDKAAQVYIHLLALLHEGNMPKSTANTVLLAEGPLNREQMRFLECLADAVHCPCEVRYQPRPTASMEGR